MTSVDVTGDDCFKACFEIRKEKPEPYLNFISRFPTLESLSLRYASDAASWVDGEIEDESDGAVAKREERWLDVHLPFFPPTLTRLCLNTSTSTELHKAPFPVTLEHLEIGYPKLERFAWIFDLHRLQTLKLCGISEVSYSAEVYQKSHPTLSTFHLICDYSGDLYSKISGCLTNVFPALPGLQDFGVLPIATCSTKRFYKTLALDNLVHIKTLSCRYQRVVGYPKGLVELQWLSAATDDSDDKYEFVSEKDILNLPPSLRTLYAPTCMMEFDDFGHLEALTSLTIAYEYHETPLLPPLLTFLNMQEFTWDVKVLKDLSKSLPHLRVAVGFNGIFAKTRLVDLSLSRSGWTNLMYAAYQKDFDALHGLVVEVMKLPHTSEEMKLSFLWENTYSGLTELRKSNIEHIQLPLESLDWFRLRGLCTFPGRIDRVSFVTLLHANTMAGIATRSFFQWAAPYLDQPDWNGAAGSRIRHLESS